VCRSAAVDEVIAPNPLLRTPNATPASPGCRKGFLLAKPDREGVSWTYGCDFIHLRSL
jgi:hypothetical protein